MSNISLPQESVLMALLSDAAARLSAPPPTLAEEQSLPRNAIEFIKEGVEKSKRGRDSVESPVYPGLDGTYNATGSVTVPQTEHVAKTSPQNSETAGKVATPKPEQVNEGAKVAHTSVDAAVNLIKKFPRANASFGGAVGNFVQVSA